MLRAFFEDFNDRQECSVESYSFSSVITLFFDIIEALASLYCFDEYNIDVSVGEFTDTDAEFHIGVEVR